MADLLKSVGYAVVHSAITDNANRAFIGSASKAYTIIGLQIANIHATDAATFECMIDSAAGVSSDSTLVKDISIPVNDTLSLLQGGKLVLNASDVLRMKADASSKLMATISYLEQDV
tara:strand:- start:895 stop:1245 length:351 start_codon:yes stop_codon:yes gene_type:complete